MTEGQADNIEEAHWMALNTLEESKQLYERLLEQAKAREHTWMASRFRRKISDIDGRATILRNLLVPESASPEARAEPSDVAKSPPATADED